MLGTTLAGARPGEKLCRPTTANLGDTTPFRIDEMSLFLFSFGATGIIALITGGVMIVDAAVNIDQAKLHVHE